MQGETTKVIKRNCGLNVYPYVLLAYQSDINTEKKAAGGEKDFSSQLLWQPLTAVYEPLEMFNTLYKAHVLKALGWGWSMDTVPKGPTPLFLWDTWKLVPLAASVWAVDHRLISLTKRGRIKMSRAH